MKNFKVALAQFSPHIGNIDANTQKMVEQANSAKQQQADLIIFPELSTLGYPAEDLILRPTYKNAPQKAFAQLKRSQRYCDGVRFLYIKLKMVIA